MAGLAPAGWPRDLPPVSTPEFSATVVSWLLDRGPGDLRTSELRLLPLALATYLEHHLQGALDGARTAYARARTDLVALPPEEIERAQRALEAEGARLVQVLREVRLVRGALLMADIDKPSRP